jgi:hypothetical protein
MSSEDFKSLIVTNPDLVDEGIDVSGLRTTTDTSPFLLGNIPDYSGIQYSTLAPTKYTDLMRLFGPGLPAKRDEAKTTIPPATGGGGSGDGGQATNFNPVSTPINTPTQPDSVAGFDPGVTPGPSGFIGLDPDMDIDPRDIDDYATYTPPTSSDPFLASGAAGGANLPSTSPQEGFLASGAAGGANLPTDTGIMVEDFSEPFDDFLGRTGERVSYPGDQSGIISDAVDPQSVKTILGPDGITYDAVTGQPIYEDLDAQAAATDVVTEQDLADNTNLLQRLGLPADFDLKKAALEVGLNLVAGVPITLIGKALGAVLPDRDPRQTALDEFYTTGAGAQYMDPSNPNYIPGMENYNIVSGNPLDPNYGLQNAYQKRLETINKTLGKMTLEEYQNTDLVQRKKDIEEAMAKEKAMLDQLQYGDPEKIAAGIQTADDDSGSEMLDTTTAPVTGIEGPPSQISGPQVTAPGTGTIASDRFDTFPPDYITDDITDAELYGDTTPGGAIPPGEIGGPGYIEPPMTLADDRLNKMTDYVDLDDFDTTPTLDSPAMSLAEARAAMTQPVDIQLPDARSPIKLGDIDPYQESYIGDNSIFTTNIYESPRDRDPDPAPAPTPTPTVPDFISGGGRDRDDSPAPSSPSPNKAAGQAAEDAQRAAIRDAAKTGMTVNQAKESVGMPANLGDTGGGDNQSNAGKIVCTMMNESYGFGSFRNKIWMKFHKDLSPEYQKGYHKLFLPLVKIAKTNKVVKKVLEHIAVHSTIDMRQATRGKTHLLGRVYRKILLPLCYWVGKHAKR